MIYSLIYLLKIILFGKNPKFSDNALYIDSDKIANQLNLKKHGKVDGKKSSPHDLQDDLTFAEINICKKLQKLLRNNWSLVNNALKARSKNIAENRYKIESIFAETDLNDQLVKIKAICLEVDKIKLEYNKILSKDKNDIAIKSDNTQYQFKSWLESLKSKTSQLLDIQNNFNEKLKALQDLLDMQPDIKDNMDEFISITKIYKKYLDNVKKDTRHIFDIYYNYNRLYRSDKINYANRYSFIEREKLQLQEYTLDEDLQKEFLDNKNFYDSILAKKLKATDNIKIADSNIKTILANYELLEKDIQQKVNNESGILGSIFEGLGTVFQKPESKTHTHGIHLKYPKVSNIAHNLKLEKEGKKDAQHELPNDKFKRLTTAEVKIKEKINNFCNGNFNKFTETTLDAMRELNKDKEELRNDTQLTNIRDKLKDLENNKNNKEPNAPDVNNVFSELRQSYQELYDFRNENRIESEKEFDRSSFRLIAPIVLGFFVFLEMLYTGFQLAPNFGLGRAYGQFGGF